MHRAFAKLLSVSYQLLDRLIPKSNHICFLSFPDFEDNSLACYEYIVSKNQDRRVYWLTTNKNSTYRDLTNKLTQPLAKSKNTRIAPKNSIAGILHFLRAKQVFFTHGHYSFANKQSKNQLLVNLWHGMPLKAIGSIDSPNRSSFSQRCDYTICSSAFFAPIMAKAFDLPEQNVLQTGLPRCDTLFVSNPKAIQFKTEIARGKKLILWLPTYQSSNIGDVRNDATIERQSLIDEFKKAIHELSTLAANSDTHIAVKLHPMDFMNEIEFREPSNLTIFSKLKPCPQNIKLYELLAVSDGLITDLSSVAFDYMATEKPILITKWIFDTYSRGLCFDPSLMYNAVDICNNWQESSSFFQSVQSGKTIKTKNTRLFNQFQDGSSCDRLYKAITQ